MGSQCMESKVDWMQGELNKIVRVMDSKLASQKVLPLRSVSLPLLERMNALVKCFAKPESRWLSPSPA